MIHNDSKYLKSKIGKELFTNFTLNNVYYNHEPRTSFGYIHPLGEFSHRNGLHRR